MTQNLTPLQNLNDTLDNLQRLKEAQALLDLFELVNHFTNYKQSKSTEILQFNLLKDAYQIKASKLIEEMEASLGQLRNNLK